jgi:ABC-type lipoprotein export system ATPase subunit
MLIAQEVTLSYGATTIVEGLDAGFPREAITAITGPSGSGKSTLLAALGLMLTLRAGRILLDGQRVDDGSDADRSLLRAEAFGFVFQDALLDPARTVLDNVLEGERYRRVPGPRQVERALGLLDELGVRARASARPQHVSGGQAQRIALCRALFGSPRVILADEPTGNLDAESAGVVESALRTAARGGAVVVVVTHDSELAARCDRQVAL